MRDSYIKPAMETESVDIPVLANQGGSSIGGGGGSPVAQNQPYFGLCCP